jgi:hypothetical protein
MVGVGDDYRERKKIKSKIGGNCRGLKLFEVFFLGCGILLFFLL